MKPSLPAFLFLPLWLLFSACSNDAPDDMQALRGNRYDFPEFTRKNYGDLYFDCPAMLNYSYFNDYLYKKDGMSLANMNLGIYLSVEKFTKAEAEKFLFYFDNEENISMLDAVHMHYMNERMKSLKYYEKSIRSALPEGTTLPGSMEVIYGRQDDYGQDLKYMIATVEKGGNWYVMQFITSHELSAYLFDDFKKIIRSAR